MFRDEDDASYFSANDGHTTHPALEALSNALASWRCVGPQTLYRERGALESTLGAVALATPEELALFEAHGRLFSEQFDCLTSVELVEAATAEVLEAAARVNARREALPAWAMAQRISNEMKRAYARQWGLIQNVPRALLDRVYPEAQREADVAIPYWICSDADAEDYLTLRLAEIGARLAEIGRKARGVRKNKV